MYTAVLVLEELVSQATYGLNYNFFWPRNGNTIVYQLILLQLEVCCSHAILKAHFKVCNLIMQILPNNLALMSELPHEYLTFALLSEYQLWY